MTSEALLSYAHLMAILSLVVFSSSQAALCRVEWLNAKVVERLVVLDRIYALAALAVLLTGLARIAWGGKGASWYWANSLLHLKLGLFILIALMSIKPTVMFLRWRRQLRSDGSLPPQAEVRQARRWVMIEAHLVTFIPLAAVFLARGFG